MLQTHWGKPPKIKRRAAGVDSACGGRRHKSSANTLRPGPHSLLENTKRAQTLSRSTRGCPANQVPGGVQGLVRSRDWAAVGRAQACGRPKPDVVWALLRAEKERATAGRAPGQLRSWHPKECPRR